MKAHRHESRALLCRSLSNPHSPAAIMVEMSEARTTDGPTLQPERAIEILEACLRTGEELLKSPIIDTHELQDWRADTAHKIELSFGAKASAHLEFLSHNRRLQPYEDRSAHDHHNCERLVGCLRRLVKRIRTELELQVAQRPSAPSNQSVAPGPLPKPSDKVFVVHGHDHGAKEAVARCIEGLGLKPIILHEQVNGGRTVIEKLEQHADVGFAVVLLTPDDVGAPSKGSRKRQPRARQNVILELGYFMAKLGRGRVCTLCAEGVERPSDILGVVYEPFVLESSEWRTKLTMELRAAGLPVRKGIRD